VEERFRRRGEGPSNRPPPFAEQRAQGWAVVQTCDRWARTYASAPGLTLDTHATALEALGRHLGPGPSLGAEGPPQCPTLQPRAAPSDAPRFPALRPSAEFRPRPSS